MTMAMKAEARPMERERGAAEEEAGEEVAAEGVGAEEELGAGTFEDVLEVLLVGVVVFGPGDGEEAG